ncbi:C2 domain-containing protein 3-like [Antedon mediterranea]|uniref:C2 domain-containing protein 3-like n=1 Tax=Antedon mediterranea TaxID=105859 RepID=UPI003AF584C5
MIQAELDSWKNPAMLASQPLRRSDELLHVLESDTRHQLPASVRGHEIMDPFRVDTHDSTEFNDLETRTVELVLGDAVPNNKLKLLQKFQDDVDAVSVSSNSDADGGMMSELEDPIHDDTILKELFYKNVESSSDSLSDILSSEDEKLNQSNNRSISIDDPGNIRPPSRKSSRVSSRQGSHSSQPDTGRELGHRLQNRDDVSDDDVHSLSARSEGSRVSFDDVIEDEVKGHGFNVVEGLSIERLTLLGRVNVARVNIDHMILENISSEAPTPSRTPKSRKLKSRPPRPVQKRKRTYLVEYKFPVVATSRDGGSKVTTATEVMRLASKKVQESNVTFTHRSVFPVRFDETAVNRWWQHLLVFKIFTRTAGQKTPDLLGVASVSLRSVLESSGLGIQVEIPVKDKKDRGRWSGSDSDKLNEDGDKIVAHLQV